MYKVPLLGIKQREEKKPSTKLKDALQPALKETARGYGNRPSLPKQALTPIQTYAPQRVKLPNRY